MKITKEKNVYDTYTVKLKEEQKEVVIYKDKQDLYIAITDGMKLIKWFDDCRWLDINDKNKDVLNIVGNLYEGLDKKKELTYEDNGLLLVSDDGIYEDEDRLIVQNYGDMYRLFFIRKNTEENKKYKPSRSIVVKIAGSGSRYPASISDFYKMYQDLKEIAEEKVKVSFEEQAKVLRKK